MATIPTNSEEAFHFFLLTSALLCTLCFGFVLIFLTVIMPGIAELDNAAYLRAFQVIDGVIQKNQPIFVFCWIGSIVSLIATTGLAFRVWRDDPRMSWLLAAVLIYLSGQASTFAINVPLNGRVQKLNIRMMDDLSLTVERQHFEAQWNFWNLFRTIAFALVSVFLLVALLVE